MTVPPFTERNVLPELEQLLIEVVVSAEPHTAWQTWRSAIDWDGHLDRHSYALLPLVYKNLIACGIDDPLLARFKGIMRRNWVENQRLLKPVASIAQRLVSANIAYTLLPPYALPVANGTLKKGADGLRIGIARSEDVATIAALGAHGWTPFVQIPNKWLAGYLFGQGHIHGVIDGQPLEILVDDVLYLQRQTRRFLGVDVAIPDVTACLHDMCAQPPNDTLFAQLVDLLLLLSVYADGVDAERFAALCEAQPLDLSAETILAWGRRIRPKQIPANLYQSSTKPSTKTASGTFSQRMTMHWQRYQQTTNATGWRGATTTLPGYLLGDWQLSTLRHLPLRAWKGLKSDWASASPARN